MGNQKETQKNPQYKYASTREKLCFGIGAIGKDAICNLVGAFLMLYFTDTLYLAPAFVGVLFFVARIWDAINDPMMGMIVDNTHTRFGKFRIWLVIGTLVNSVVFVLLFHSFNLSGTALYVYVSVMYILYGMTYTIMDVPYWSWLPNLTNDPHEREKVSVIPRFFASLAGFSVATFGLYIINYLNKIAGESNLYAEKGYTLFAIIIAVIFIVTIGITVFNVKEESTLGISAEKTSLKQAFQVIVKNENAYYNDEEGELVRMNDTIYTDSGGEFVSQMMRDGWVDTKKLIFNDIDGEANGGTFKSDSVCMKDMESKQIKKGDGNWYLGTYEYNMEIKLSKEDK